jgi:hypothetical protein
MAPPLVRQAEGVKFLYSDEIPAALRITLLVRRTLGVADKHLPAAINTGERAGGPKPPRPDSPAR